MYRNLFWHLEPGLVYLDNAASTPPFKEVINQVKGFLKTYGSIHRGAGKLSMISTDKYEEAREKVGSFVKANKNRDAVVFTDNTTGSINRLAMMYPWDSWDQVLASDIEHSSNLLPWHKFAEVKTFYTEQGFIYPEAIEEELKESPRVRIVAITGASNLTGQIVDLKSIWEICQKHKAYLFVDGSQLCPHAPVSMDYCDALSFSGHKMYAPFGIGALVARKNILEETGLAPTGGGNVSYINKNNIPTYAPVPHRHEIGTPNGVGAIALAAAVDVYKQLGWKQIRQHEQDINSWFNKYLGNIKNLTVFFKPPVDGTPIRVFQHQTIKSAGIAEFLSQKNIMVREGLFCSYRLAENILKRPIYPTHSANLLIRASGGLMTTENDIKQLANALKILASDL